MSEIQDIINNTLIYCDEKTSQYLKENLYIKNDLASSVFLNKYALKDNNGERLENTPLEMHIRLAKEFERIESKYINPLELGEILSSMLGFTYIIPQGSPMAGIGNNNTFTSLGNCTVIGNDVDSIGGILHTDQEQVHLMKARCGVGHDLTHLRPRGFKVNNSCGKSTGLITFMNRYSESTRQTAQEGRRGALMLTLSVHHPDIYDFINSKQDLTKITGANISVKLTDEFMMNVIENGQHELRFPVDSPNPVFSKKISAVKLWDKIIKNAHSTGEPGLLFWDKVLRESPADCYEGFSTISTNPCGELPLCWYDSCRLLVVNLYSFVEFPFNKERANFNFEKFQKYIWIAQRMMDDLIDLEEEKMDKIIKKIESNDEDERIKIIELDLWRKMKEKLLKGRRTGLGITAEGDMLAALGLRYGSESSIKFAHEIHKFMAIEAYKCSVQLAKERGCFPIYDYKKDMKSEFIKRITSSCPELHEDMKKYGRRNIAILTIAPTGSVSILAETTSGIEPVFSISYKRKRKLDEKEYNLINNKENVITDELGDKWLRYNVIHHKFEEYLKIRGIDVDINNDAELEKAYKDSPYYGSTANDIDYVAKTKMQGEIQKWVDHSISCTVNVPKKTTIKTIGDVYKAAWESGCKGCTVYRDGSRFGVLETKESIVLPKKRPNTLSADVIYFRNGGEKWIAFIGKFGGVPYEIFTGKEQDINKELGGHQLHTNFGKIFKSENDYNFEYVDKTGGTHILYKLNRQFDERYWDYSILVSKLLRSGFDLVKLVDLISNLRLGGESANTWKRGVARALAKYISSGTISGKQCDCGEIYIYQEGCLICHNCGNSKCN